VLNVSYCLAEKLVPGNCFKWLELIVSGDSPVLMITKGGFLICLSKLYD
jgi:hypothetical protein